MNEKILTKLSNWQGRMPDEGLLYSAIGGEFTMKEFRKALQELTKNGQIMKTQRGKWAIPSQIGFCVGKVQRTQKGYGFLLPLDKTLEDVFLPAHNLKGAMSDDIVIVSLAVRTFKGKEKTEGEVFKILERGRSVIVGTLELIPSGGFVVPDDKKFSRDIYIPKGKINNAKNAEKVVVNIIEYPKDKRSPVGQIVEIIGNANDVGVDILSLIKSKGLNEKFSEEVLKQANILSKQDPGKFLKGRLDLRKERTMTIDGSDSKDFDDAVSIEKVSKDVWRLGVHIADVSHYVKDGTMVGDEALERATSVYLVDRVIPMLPKDLSNNICSLNEGVDRLTMSCIMDINKSGDVISHKISRSIISSQARLTYEQVNLVLNKDKEARKSVKGLVKDLVEMNKLAKVLRKKRYDRGSIELDIAEPHILLDDDGIPVSIKARERGDSHKLIEEFMLCANETVARFAQEKNVPFMYRIHGQPDAEKMSEYARFSGNLGYNLKGSSDSITPKQLQDMLDTAKGKKEEDVLHRVMLRTLQKAIYGPDNKGHFGLASEYYCHFTSPIRRYPDLVVHRVLKAIIDDDAKYLRMLRKKIVKLSEECSEKERTAMEVERKVDDLKMTEYMTQHIGEEFDAIIAGVKDFGFFVELENTIEGLVHVSDLQDDHYVYYEQGYMLKGQRTSREFRLGDNIRVKCTGANVSTCNIDFALPE